MKLWRDNDSVLGIKHCYPGNFNHRSTTRFFSHQLLPGNKRSRPQVFSMCRCVCVWWGNRVCIEEPWGYFINLHGESFLFLLDKTLFCPFFITGGPSALDFCPVIIRLRRDSCQASPLKESMCASSWWAWTRDLERSETLLSSISEANLVHHAITVHPFCWLLKEHMVQKQPGRYIRLFTIGSWKKADGLSFIFLVNNFLSIQGVLMERPWITTCVKMKFTPSFLTQAIQPERSLKRESSLNETN